MNRCICGFYHEIKLVQLVERSISCFGKSLCCSIGFVDRGILCIRIINVDRTAQMEGIVV